MRQAASLLELAAQRASDASVLLKLATVRRSMGDLSGAMQAAAAAVELAPRNFLMAMLLGSLREATGAIHAAERAYRVACAAAPLDLSFQPAIAKQLARARKRVDAVEDWRRRLLSWEPDQLPGLTHPEQRRLRQFRTNILENLDAGPIAPPVFLLPGIRPERYFDPGEFPGVTDVERHTDAIREEFLAVVRTMDSKLAAKLAGAHSGDAAGGRPSGWSMIPLIRNGRVVEEFAGRCPVTMRLAAALEMPRLGLISPSLYFSVLAPGARIAPHTGITNARVIAHFPLIVPPNCGFRVGGETRPWVPGTAMIFDDMNVHEAWNDSDANRVVLIADLWRPELSTREREGVEMLMDCGDAAGET